MNIFPDSTGGDTSPVSSPHWPVASPMATLVSLTSSFHMQPHCYFFLARTLMGITSNCLKFKSSFLPETVKPLHSSHLLSHQRGVSLTVMDRPTGRWTIVPCYLSMAEWSITGPMVCQCRRWVLVIWTLLVQISCPKHPDRPLPLPPTPTHLPTHPSQHTGHSRSRCRDATHVWKKNRKTENIYFCHQWPFPSPQTSWKQV